jgi:TP901 family phage tail tape measure protein
MAKDAVIKLSLIDGVSKNLEQIRTGVTGVGASLVKLNSAAELAGKGFALIGSAVGSIGDAVTEAANLEAAMSRVADITQATAQEQVALQAAVQSAVSTVGVSADQAAAALLLMAEDGFSASEAIGSLNTVLSFAKANAQDAATATQALGGVLDTFGEKPAIIAQLADQLTAASRAAGVGTTTLQNGLAAIGVQAEQAGLGVSEATAALAALASRGIEGTQAAKQLGTVLTELNNPASKAGEALKQAGLSGKSFGEVVDVLSKDSAKAAPILEALGNRPRAALKVLLADGGGALREFTGIVNEAGNASAEAAAKVDETFLGALARFQASIGNLRNEFLEPILQPLADEFTALSVRLNELAGSPEFARIRTQFQEFATAAIQSIGDLVANVDLEQLAGKISDFGESAKRTFDALVVVVEFTAKSIKSIGESLDSFADATKYLREFNDAVNGAINPLSNLANLQGLLIEKTEQTPKALGKSSAALKTFGEFIGEATRGVGAAAGKLNEFGKAATGAADDVAVISSPSKDAKDALLRLSGGAEQAALGLERLRLATLGSAIAKLANDGQAATAEYAKLTAQFSETERKIIALTSSSAENKDATDQQTESVNNLRVALQNLGQQQDNVDQGNRKVSRSGSQVSEEFGNIGKAAKAAKADMGNMSKELLDLAISLQSQARSGREIIEIWKGITDQYNQSNERIEYAIELRRRQLGVMDEEEQVRKRLQQQYGTDSTLLEELVQLELKRLAARRESLGLAERELEVEKERLGLAGGFGATPAAAQSAPTATAGRGGPAAGGSRDAQPAIVVNINGLPTDQSQWNDLVASRILPALQRIDRLSR